MSEEDEKIFNAFYDNFLKLAEIPRPSHHEEKISKFLYEWAADKGYDVHKDDAMNVIFDVVAMRDVGTYYDPFMKPRLGRDISWDNIVLFSYASRMLSGEDSDVKNVIIDISCNQGGIVPAMFYMLDAIIGKSDIEVYYANTKSHQNLAVDCDLNLDGVIDENDKSFREMGKNVAVIVSDTSFSCGNALPVFLKYLDRDVLVLGQNSGGGSSFVAETATAAGTIFNYSSSYSMVTRQNGEIKYVDEGVRPDIYLSTQKMYDRDYVAQLVRDTFGS